MSGLYRIISLIFIVHFSSFVNRHGTNGLSFHVGSRLFVGDITESGIKQSEMVTKISDDISRISGVVQTNSATAEESAAASEELSGQAGILKQLIGTFKL